MKKRSDVLQYLITDPAFRDWVQNPTEKSDYFWKKWMEEHPRNISEVKAAREFIERLRFEKKELSANELDRMLGGIIAGESTAYEPVDKPRKILWPWGQWLKVAAMLLLATIALLYIRPRFLSDLWETRSEVRWVTNENGKGERTKITLPDGTVVHLSYESRLRYPEFFQGGFRNVELTGEAFFEVVHNKRVPFIVKTDCIETEVLGTSFNIRAYPGEKDVAVSLVKGKVKVIEVPNDSAERETRLSPGEQLRYARKSRSIVVNQFDEETITGWKDGIMFFKDASLEEFIDKLARWYGVDFQVYGSPSKEWKVNGRYQNERLDDILIGLKFIYGLDYQIQGKNVTIKLN